GDADRFSMLVEQYQAAPEVTRKRLWLETVQEVLADNRKVVGGDSRQLIYVPMEPAKAGTAASGALAPENLAPTVTAIEQAAEQSTRSGRTPRPTGREEVTR
ncbi:MAG: FtsH protease activity modulator HflK, partial [Lysobacter sp.]|nr:FtsH protease activity modulator HflK [Lysobacter sp.]